MIRFRLLLLLLFLSSSSVMTGADANAANANMLTDWFVQWDASGPATCDHPLAWRKADWGVPDGYQRRDSVISCDKRLAIETFSTPPFHEFVAAHGDGGEIYAYDGHEVRATATQDGGTAGMQYFTGHGYDGGTGWLVWWDGVAYDSCAERVAKLSRSVDDPDAKPPLSSAYTKVCWNNVWIPFIWYGAAPVWALAPAITSIHCAGDSLASATSCERMIFAMHWGLVRWDAWNNSTRSSSVDLSQRCPAEWTPPAYGLESRPDMKMVDCRMLTNLVHDDSQWSLDKFRWPAAGAGSWP